MRTVLDEEGREVEVENKKFYIIECLPEHISSLDLQDEMRKYPTTRWETYQASTDDPTDTPEKLEILYSPDDGRAGITWGADADWTDCSSAEDALDRYFQNDGKFMAD